MTAVNDPELIQKYKQMYMLRPQNYMEPEGAEDINSADKKEHW